MICIYICDIDLSILNLTFRYNIYIYTHIYTHIYIYTYIYNTYTYRVPCLWVVPGTQTSQGKGRSEVEVYYTGRGSARVRVHIRYTVWRIFLFYRNI